MWGQNPALFKIVLTLVIAIYPRLFKVSDTRIANPIAMKITLCWFGNHLPPRNTADNSLYVNIIKTHNDEKKKVFLNNGFLDFDIFVGRNGLFHRIAGPGMMK